MWLRGCTPWGGSVFVCGRPLLVLVGLVPVGLVPVRACVPPLYASAYNPCPFLGTTPCPFLGAERLSGLTAPIFRPRCCGFTDGLRTVPGGFTDGLSDIAVSAFNVAVVRFCGSFCPVLMSPLSGFENRSFFSRLVRPARCGSLCSLALRGEGSGNTERK